MNDAADFDPTVEGMPHTMRAPAPDSDARSFLRFFNALAPSNLDAMPLALLRQRWRMVALAMGRRDFSGEMSQKIIDGPDGRVKLRIYAPRGKDESRPVFVWFHGGAFLIGEADTADSICRNIVNMAGCVVIAVEYRLAPEHDLYAGRADCIAALDWIYEHGHTIGLDAERIAIGGDSAGGNLAAVLAQHCHAKKRPLRLQVLVYPATNLGDDFPSKTQNAEGFLLTKQSIDWITKMIGDGLDYRDPKLSPAYAKNLSGLAPALVLTAGFDPIRDDGLWYAHLLRQAGVPVELLHYAGQFHGFVNFDSVLSAARDALDRMAFAIGSALSGADALPNRTIEITDVETERDGGSFVREWMTAGFMGGEWLEYQRNRMLRAMWPGASNPFGGNRLFNMAATLRGMVTASTLSATETFASDAKATRARPKRRAKAG